MPTKHRHHLGPSFHYAWWILIRMPHFWVGMFLLCFGFSLPFRVALARTFTAGSPSAQNAFLQAYRFQHKHGVRWYALAGCSACAAYAFVRWRTTRYYIEGDCVFAEEGIMVRRNNMIAGSLIFDVDSIQTLPQVACGAGNVIIRTADKQMQHVTLRWVRPLEQGKKAIREISAVNDARLLGSI